MSQYLLLSLILSVIFNHGTVGGIISMSPNEVSSSVKILTEKINFGGRITALVCWDLDYTLRFSRAFNGNSNIKMSTFTVKLDQFHSIDIGIPDQHHEMFIVDTGCDNIILEQLFNQTQTQLERHWKWIFLNVVDSARIYEDVVQCLSNQPILLRSAVFYIVKVSTFEYEYHQVYRIKPSQDSLLIHSNYGNFRDGIFHKTSSVSSFDDRRNLHGLLQTAGTVLNSLDSIERYRNYSDPAIDSYMKCILWVHTEIMNFANGSVKFQDSVLFGYYDKKANTWSGLLGELKLGKVDMAGTPFFFTAQRVNYFDFLGSIHVPQVHFMFRRPTLSNTNNIFLLPFDERVWICTILMIFVLVALLNSVVCMEWHRVSEELRSNDTILHPQLGESWIVMFGATCQQGAASVPFTPVARMVMVLSFVSMMFLFTSYSANITVLLQSPSNKIQTIPHLMQSGFVMALHNNSWNDLYFSERADPLGRAVYKTKITNPDGSKNIIGENRGMQLVRAGKYALHVEDSTAYQEVSLTFQEYEKCLLQKIRYVPDIPPYVAIKKNSPYYEVIKVGFLRVQEQGVYGRHKQRYFPQKPDCSGSTQMFVPATLLDTLPAFEIIICGVGAAIFVCLAEMLCFRFKDRILQMFLHKRFCSVKVTQGR